MAHTRVLDKDARIIAQCAAGRYVRNIASQTFVVTADRAADDADSRKMADFTTLSGDTCLRGFFVAPCNAKIESIMVNGNPWIATAASGEVVIQFYVTNTASSDMPLLSDNSSLGILIGGCATSGAAATACGLSTAGITYVSGSPTVDGTLLSGFSSVAEGEAVYAIISGNGIASQSAVGVFIASIEWVPEERSYAAS